MSTPPGTRRPIKARDSKWAAKVAAGLARAGIRPNVISVASAVFGAFAGLALAYASGHSWLNSVALYVSAAVCIQLRLLCNLFDGMVAVEGGFRTKSGEIFNELPDRFADAFILVGAGYAADISCGGAVLGWTAAVLAVITAYIRTLGAAAGAGQCFMGPMAKQHRMALMTTACVIAGTIAHFSSAPLVIAVALIVMIAGMLITMVRRTRWIIATLEAR